MLRPSGESLFPSAGVNVTESVRVRMGWRMRRAFLRVFGRPISCATCGRTLFYGIAVVWRGRVRLIGAADDPHDIRVEFVTRDALEMRHVALDECPVPERPWVP